MTPDGVFSPEVQERIVTGPSDMLPEDLTGFVYRNAECKTEQDKSIFFEDDPVSVALAKEVCARCVVRTGCLELALINKEKAGVWGGKTADERGIDSAGRRTPEHRAFLKQL